MDIKDITGLSKPLTRLIDVISQGIGAVSGPYLIRRTADAKAHEVRVIAAAVKDVADQHQLPVVFKDGQIELWQRPEDRTLVLDDSGYENRATSRIEYRERKRQSNVESITSIAATELCLHANLSMTFVVKAEKDWNVVEYEFPALRPNVSSR